jgi:hypothetical protein
MHTFPGPTPTTDDELAAWLKRWLDLDSPRAALLENHTPPFAYLAHAFFEDRTPRDCVVWANRGGGKTFLGAVATALDLVFKPGIEIRVLAGSLEQAGRMQNHLRDLFERPGFSGMVEGRITERRIRLSNGSTVETLAQSQTSVRGTRVQKLRCDEVELFDPAVWDAAQLTTRSKECGNVRVRGAIECLSTMHVPYGIMHDLVAGAMNDNARSLFRWGVVDTLGPCRDDDHQCLTDDGPCPLAAECAGLAKARDRRGEPAGHIPVSDAVAMKRRVSLETWNAEMLCLRPRRSDTVLPEFDPAIHAIDRLPVDAAAWPVVAGMDFGIRSPTVVLWARLSPGGVLFVHREYAECNRTLDQHVRAILDAPERPAWIGVDPAGRARNGQSGKTDIQILTESGLVVRAAAHPTVAGLDMVRARLRPACGTPRLFITRGCPRLIESLERYHYPAAPETQTPAKDGHDHAPDALRYLIQNLDAAYTTTKGNYLVA